MKKIIVTKFIVVVILTFGFRSNAQKLPNIQQKSLRAPANIIVDGHTKEWKNTFQAFNKNKEIFYTLSNDDQKLYISIQVVNPVTIRKIIAGGISFRFNTSGSKNDTSGTTITYPMYDKNNRSLTLIVDNTKLKNRKKLTSDSLMNAYNKKLTGRLKLIGVAGIEGIQDSVISIYNAEGIKAVSLFDNNLAYNYELSLPLKYIGISSSDFDRSVKVNYNIQLNGIGGNNTNIKSIPTARGDVLTFVGPDGIPYNMGIATPENLILAYPTDFWGQYTFAKK